MKRMNIDILGVSEMRWPNSGKYKINDYYLYYVGNNDSNHYNGVGSIINPDINKFVAKCEPVSDRVIFCNSVPSLFL